jgi:amphi-Trp domain-containing protein
MAKLSGRPGKSSGSPSGPGEFEQEFYMTNSEVSALFRELAQEIEAGGLVEASTNAWSLGVNPIPPIKLEIEYNPRKRELEIQVKLKGLP